MDEENKNNEVTQMNETIPQYEEVPKYQEVESKKKVVRTDSYFDGGVLELIGWRILAGLITCVTLGIASPWAHCMLYSWEIKHTVYNGKRLKFVGTGGDLFVNMFKWLFFTIITLGIYSLFIPIKKTKWIASNTHFEDEPYVKEDSYFDGNTLQLIGINILTYMITLFSFGLLFPFATCVKIGWIAKHTVINRKKIVFDGKGYQLWGKYILWSFLTVITFGIFGFWLPIRIAKWKVKHIHIKTVGEEYQRDNTIFILIPIAIALTVGIVTLLTCVVIPLLSNLEIDGERFNLFEIFNINKHQQSGSYTKDYYEEYERKQAIIEGKTVAEETVPPVENKKTSVKAGKYTLKYGTYKGTAVQGVWDDTTMTSKAKNIDITLVLTEDRITFDGQTTSYKISGTEIKVKGYDFTILEATGNNEITYYAETCPKLTYQGD